MKQEPILEELVDRLVSTGMTPEGAERLLSKFLMEQAEDFVVCLELMKRGIEVKSEPRS